MGSLRWNSHLFDRTFTSGAPFFPFLFYLLSNESCKTTRLIISVRLTYCHKRQPFLLTYIKQRGIARARVSQQRMYTKIQDDLPCVRFVCWRPIKLYMAPSSTNIPSPLFDYWPCPLSFPCQRLPRPEQSKRVEVGVASKYSSIISFDLRDWNWFDLDPAEFVSHLTHQNSLNRLVKLIWFFRNALAIPILIQGPSKNKYHSSEKCGGIWKVYKEFRQELVIKIQAYYFQSHQLYSFLI